MSWLSDLLQPITRSQSISSSQTNMPGFWKNMFVGGTSSTFYLDKEESALKISTVWACVRVLSETMASLSLGVYKEDNNGNIIRQYQHPVHELIHNRPHPLYNSFNFFETLIIQAVLKGNGIALIETDMSGKITGLKLQDPDFVTVYVVDGKLMYMITKFDHELKVVSQSFTSDQVIHIKSMSTDGIWGHSPIKVCRESFEEAGNQISQSNNFYKNGTQLSGLVSYDGTLNEAAAESMRKSWKKKYSGSANTGEVAFLGNNAKFQALSLSQKDSEYILSRKISIEDIARIFRVPLHMINSMDRATFNNIEQMSIEFVTHTIRPWVKRIEKELNEKLFLSREKSAGIFCRYNIESLLRGDTAARTTMYRELFNIGVLSQNDIRKLESLNPIDNGDKYYVPLNMVPSDQVPDNNQDNETEE